MALIEKISEDLNIDKQYLRNIAKRNNLYKKYYIPKNKKRRLIMQPTRELKVVQYWLCKNIFSKFEKSNYSSASEKGCSILKNAKVHSENSYILHMDIEDFFPSINRKMLIKLFRNNSGVVNELKLSNSDIEYILDIVLYKGENLVIGSVSSPLISNLVMYDFDNEVKNMLDKKGEYVYTRYADDIVVSSKQYIPKEIVSDIENIMAKFSFIPNKEKTYFMNKSAKRQITGVVIDNNSGKITIGTDRYKKIKSQIYKFLVKNEGDVEKIRGYLAFVESINKEQYKQLKNIYLRYDKDKKLFHK